MCTCVRLFTKRMQNLFNCVFVFVKEHRVHVFEWISQNRVRWRSAVAALCFRVELDA